MRFLVAEHQNITLTIPLEILRRVQRLAADLRYLGLRADDEGARACHVEDRRYAAAKKRALGAMKAARSLGTPGRPTWTRDELHER